MLLIYNHFDSPLVQTVVVEQLLPVPLDELEQVDARELALQGLLLFEPEEEDMLPDLLRDGGGDRGLPRAAGVDRLGARRPHDAPCATRPTTRTT